MTSEYKVIWTNVAENDLKNIIAYIAEDSPQNALNILNNIRQKASHQYALPERGRIVPELQDQGIVLGYPLTRDFRKRLRGGSTGEKESPIHRAGPRTDLTPFYSAHHKISWKRQIWIS